MINNLLGVLWWFHPFWYDLCMTSFGGVSLCYHHLCYYGLPGSGGTYCRCLHSGKIQANTTFYVWIHFKRSLHTGRKEKPMAANRPIWKHWETEAWRPPASNIYSWGEEERDSRVTTFTEPCSESLSTGRMVITGCRQWKLYWEKRKGYSCCWVAGFRLVT